MGQSTSSLYNTSLPMQGGLRDPGVLGFLGLFFSSLHQPLQQLPASWEELLLWTQVFSSWKLVSLLPMATNENLNENPEEVLPSAFSATIEFEPIVDVNRTDDVARLSSFSWINRAIFYHHHVRIQVRNNRTQPDSTLDPPLFLTVTEMGLLYLLGRHFMELLATFQTISASDPATTLSDCRLCEICCTLNENAQLPCGHALCEECEKRWVARQLTCPFCRARFESQTSAARNGWNITEFDAGELQEDMQITLHRIHEQWQSIQCRNKKHCSSKDSNNDETQLTFVALPPQLLESQGSCPDFQDFELINSK